MPKRHIILWVGDKAYLYCRYQYGTTWWVLNGAWALDLSYPYGKIIHTQKILRFDGMTEAPPNLDYNKALSNARRPT